MPQEARRAELGAVLVPNLGARYSGVTSVIRTTTPYLQRLVDADLMGRPAGALEPRRGLGTLLSGFRRPAGHPFRIWHARRNIEMVVGLALRLFGWPLRIVFTSAGQRRHTRFTRALIARVDAVIATTTQAAGFVQRPSTLIPHGIDCELFRPATDRAAAWQARGVGGRFGIGVFGRVRHQKGTDLFVEALIALLPRYPDFTAVVVGLCKPEDAAFLAALRARVVAAGLAERLLFLGEVPADELPRWLAAVSICVAPQRHEGFGLVPLEAAASATPVVAARAGAADLIVAEGSTGYLVPTGDAGALAAAIERLMADPAGRDAMGAAARDRVVEHFAITREVERYLEVYRTLWAGDRP